MKLEVIGHLWKCEVNNKHKNNDGKIKTILYIFISGTSDSQMEY